MNGIQSLMQGAPTSPQPTQAPAMPAQNNPQMAAAMDVVDNDLDKLNLDPRTKALLKTQEAYDLIQSAQNELAMSQPQPMPPTIEGQRKMQTMDGIAGMLQSLRPGMQQRGQQVQQAQARQMMGGLPTQPAPNMRFAASGGLIGYNEGGFLGKVKEIDTKLNAGADAAQNERMARGRRMGDYNVLADPYNSAMNIMYDTGIAGALQKLTGYKSQLDKPEEKDPMAEQLKRFMELQDIYEARKAAGAGEEELRRIEQELASYSNVVRNIEVDAERARAGMAMGGQVKGYAEGELVEYDYMSDPNLYAPTQVEEPDADILKFAIEQMNRDVGAESIAAGERLRELTGAEDLMAQRKTAQEALQAQREARFNPEMERRRKLRAALAKGSEMGLGGFGSGYTAEEERIAGEKLSAAEASVADMDKLIGELRELGLSQFEAEKQARDTVESNVRQGMSTAQAVTTARRQAADAAEGRDVQRRGQDITAETQKYVADQGLKRTSAQDRGVKALMDEAEAAGKPISEAEALRQYFGMQASMQGVFQRGQQGDITNRLAVIEAVDELISLPLSPEGRAYAEAKREGTGDVYRQSLIDQRLRDVGLSPTSDTSASTATQSVDVSSINPTAIQNLRDNPTAQNRAFFDQAFGVGSAAAVLGQ
jgi:hypothetical protein